MTTKGNQEIRFRADKEIHRIAEVLQDELGLNEKTSGIKLLIALGNDRIKDTVNYIDQITHPLNDRQFNDFFASLKIRIKQLRESRKKVKTLP